MIFVKTQDSDPPRRSRWWLVPFGLIAATLVGWSFMIHLAVSDPSFAVEPDYYRKAADWDQRQAQEKQNQLLGWQAKVRAVSGRDGASIMVLLRDSAKEPVSRAEVRVEAFHNARAANAQTHVLTEGAVGEYSVRRARMRPGLWEFRITALRGSSTFTQVITQDVAVGDAP